MAEDKALEAHAGAPADISAERPLPNKTHQLTPDGQKSDVEKATSNRSSVTLSTPDANQETSVAKPSTPGLDAGSFPDGGLAAWSVVLGGFMALFVSFGTADGLFMHIDLC